MRRILSIALLSALACIGQVQPPSTPAGKVFAEWLAAVNSNDKVKIGAFQKLYAPDRDDFMERSLDIREHTRGFELVAVKESEPLRLAVTLKEGSGRYAEMEFAISEAEHPKVGRMRVSPGSAPGTAPPPRPPAPEPVANLDELIAQMDAQAVKAQFSGTVLVAKDGKPVFRKAYGMADREQNKPMALDSQLRMGSMNKMFTSIATLQLVDKGKLDLDTPIGKYLKDYPNKDVASKVTLRHLLTHQGGTGDIFTPEYQKARLEVHTLSDYVKLFGARGLQFEPGSKWEYSNYGFVLLGCVIEAVTGASYYDYVRENIFRPAGMTSTDSLPESEIVPKRAVGYLRNGKPNTETLPWRASSAGGGYTTVDDLFRFAIALQSGKLLSKKLLDEATSVQARSENGPPYGFGFGVIGVGKNISFGHNGGAPGMNGELSVFKTNGLIFAALSNADGGGATALSRFFTTRLPR